VKPITQALLVGLSVFALGTAAFASSCPAAGTEVPFAKLMNEAFAADYIGCDVTSKVEFAAAGGIPKLSVDQPGAPGFAVFETWDSTTASIVGF
jgi:hypothetical protein